MGRPRIGEPVLIRLPADLLADVDKRAVADDVSRAEMIRRLLGQALTRRR